MEIRRTGETPPNQPRRPVQPAASQPQGKQASAGDGFTRQEEDEDTPFWLIQMSTDRLAGRQYLSKKDHQAAAKLEAAWVQDLVTRSKPVVRGFGLPDLKGKAGLEGFQHLVDGLVTVAGPKFPIPRVVWLPGMQEGRGQYLFKVSGGIIQLRPQGPGGLQEWVETVAHETFHHLQQELVTALYKGEPFQEPLAAYYRDARAAYKHLPPAEHRKQALEVGAWTYGAALAKGVRTS